MLLDSLINGKGWICPLPLIFYFGGNLWWEWLPFNVLIAFQWFMLCRFSLNLLANFLFFFMCNTPNARKEKNGGPEAEMEVVYREKNIPISLSTE